MWEFSPVRQLAALHQLGPDDIPADTEQTGRLDLVAMTEFIGCSRDRCLNLRVKVGTAVFKKLQ